MYLGPMDLSMGCFSLTLALLWTLCLLKLFEVDRSAKLDVHVHLYLFSHPLVQLVLLYCTCDVYSVSP